MSVLYCSHKLITFKALIELRFIYIFMQTPLNHAKYNINSSLFLLSALCMLTLAQIHTPILSFSTLLSSTQTYSRQRNKTNENLHFLGYQMNFYLIPTIRNHIGWHPMNYDHSNFSVKFLFSSCFDKRISCEHTYERCILSMHCYIVKLNRNSMLSFYFYSCSTFRCSLHRFVSLWTLAENGSIFQCNGVMFKHNDREQLLPEKKRRKNYSLCRVLLETIAGNSSE